jgi:hypothetical protein
MIKKILTALGCILFLAGAFAQSTPKYSNEFLTIGVGARSLAMSRSVVATVDDVTAGYWNPACLANMEDNLQLGYMHSAYFSGIANYDYAGAAFRLKKKGAMGISMVRFGIDNIPNTFDLVKNGQINYDRITAFSAVDYGFLFSYAQKSSKDGLVVGGNAKIVYRKAGQFAKAWGFGIDFSMQYKSSNNWQFAIVAKDITSTFNAWRMNFTNQEKEILTQNENEIPENSLEITLPSFQMGLAKTFHFTPKFEMTTEFDADLTTDGKRNVLLKSDPFSLAPHAGIELAYKKQIFLRGGIGNIQVVTLETGKDRIMEPNAGVGLKLGAIMLDYALTTVGKQSTALYTHVFSVRFSVNRNEKK